jgi:tetratricopeptide (TPR) repeat protein
MPPGRRPLASWSVPLAALALVAAGFLSWQWVPTGGARAHDAATAGHRPSAGANELYLTGLYQYEKRTPASLARAVLSFQSAIARDPGFAKAYGGLADCYLLLREYAGMPDRIAYPRAMAAARRALALDARLARAHAALAFATFFWKHDFERGFGGFDRAIALDPVDPTSHHWYATALLTAGEARRALDQIDEAQRLDPQSRSILADKGLILVHAGQAEAGVALLEQIETNEPDFLSPHSYLAAIRFDQGDYAGSLAEARIRARLLHDDARIASLDDAGRALARGGPPALLGTMLAQSRALYARGRASAYALAAAYASSGNRDSAFRYLAEAERRDEPDLAQLRDDHRFAAFHGDRLFGASPNGSASRASQGRRNGRNPADTAPPPVMKRRCPISLYPSCWRSPPAHCCCWRRSAPSPSAAATPAATSKGPAGFRGT